MTESTMKKILIVDDEQAVLLGLSCVLKTTDVQVFTCDEIGRAETLLADNIFDLVLADIRMSGVYGIEGLELLSYITSRYETKVMIMTGAGNNEVEAEAYRRGAHFYFNKPIDTHELLNQVSMLGIPVKYLE